LADLDVVAHIFRIIMTFNFCWFLASADSAVCSFFSI